MGPYKELSIKLKQIITSAQDGHVLHAAMSTHLDDLTDYDKRRVFDNLYRKSKAKSYPFLNFLQQDNVDCLEVLLQYTPLYTATKKYVRKHMTEIWTPQTPDTDILCQEIRCWCPNNIFDADTLATAKKKWDSHHYILARVASTVFSAELFAVACQHKAIQCMKFLLRNTPGLIKVKVDNKFAIESILQANDDNAESEEVCMDISTFLQEEEMYKMQEEIAAKMKLFLAKPPTSLATGECLRGDDDDVRMMEETIRNHDKQPKLDPHKERSTKLTQIITSAQDGYVLQAALSTHLYDLSKYDKRLILGRMKWKSEARSYPFFQNFLQQDNVGCLEALLQHTPLYIATEMYVKKHMTGIWTPQTPMTDILYTQDCYWCPNNIFDVNTMAKAQMEWDSHHYILAQVASTVFSAELFAVAYQHKAIQCMKFLLRNTPGLMKVKVDYRFAIESILQSNVNNTESEEDHTDILSYLQEKINKMLAEIVAKLITNAQDGHVLQAALSTHLDDLSMPDKRRVLEDLNWKSKANSYPFFQNFMQQDNVGCLEALLQHTPLSITTEEYVKKHMTGIWTPQTPMTDILHYCYWCPNNIFDADTMAEAQKEMDSHHYILARVGSTVFSAELFAVACQYKAIQCMKFLLRNTPGLIKVKVDNVFAIESILLANDNTGSGKDCMDISTGLQEDMNSMQREIATKMRLFVRKKPSASQESDGHQRVDGYERIKSALYKKTEKIDGDNKGRKAREQETTGNALHILIAELSTFRTSPSMINWDNTLTCIQKLTQFVDPTEKNDLGQNSLDLLFSVSLHEGNLKEDPGRMDALMKCTKLLLANWTEHKEISFLSDLFIIHRKIDNQEMCLKWLKLYELILESEVFDNKLILTSQLTPWHYFLSGWPICITPSPAEDYVSAIYYASVSVSYKTQTPCTICKPLTALLQTAVMRGLDAEYLVSVITSNSNCQSQIHTHGFMSMRNKFTCNLNTDIEVQECCYLSLLELLMHHGVDITPLVRMRPSNSFIVRLIDCITDRQSGQFGNTWFGTIPHLPSIQQMYRFCKTLILYYPHFQPSLLPSLIPNNTQEGGQILQELQAVSKTPKSLLILAKRAIAQGQRTGHYKISDLPLPWKLREFFGIGQKIEEKILTGQFL